MYVRKLHREFSQCRVLRRQPLFPSFLLGAYPYSLNPKGRARRRPRFSIRRLRRDSVKGNADSDTGGEGVPLTLCRGEGETLQGYKVFNQLRVGGTPSYYVEYRSVFEPKPVVPGQTPRSVTKSSKSPAEHDRPD